MRVTLPSNLKTAFSLGSGLAAFVAEDPELLLRVTKNRSAMTKKKVFMIDLLFNGSSFRDDPVTEECNARAS
jgi:hypothetical protein